MQIEHHRTLHITGDSEVLPELAAQLDGNHVLERAGMLFFGRPLRLGIRLPIRWLAEDDPERLDRAGAQHLNLDRLPSLRLGDGDPQLASITYLLAIEARNDIADLEPGPFGGAPGRHTAHQRTGSALEIKLPGQFGAQVL